MRFLHAAALAALTALPIACAAILGDDFDIVDTGPTGHGGAGAGENPGGAGPGGAGGEAPAPNYDCDWDSPEHRLVDSLEGTTFTSFGQVYAERRGPDSVRAAVVRWGPSSSVLDVFTLDSSANIGASSHAVLDVHQVARVSSSEIGVLYVAPNMEVRLLVFDDGDPDGAGADDILLADITNLPDFDPAVAQPRATMAPVPLGGLDDWDLDVVVSYRNVLNDNAIYYARYQGAPPSFVRISDPAVTLDDDDIQDRGMVHFDGTSYVYFGDTNASLGLRVYALDDTVSGPVGGTPIGNGEQLGPIVVLPPDYANVAMLVAGPPIRILTGAIAAADLGSFDPSDLLVAAEFASQFDLPVFESDPRWNDDIFTLIGGDADQSADMAYYLLDNEGRERGSGALDFTVVLPVEEDREHIGNAMSALRGDPLGAEGGTLHVIWSETHSRNDAQFDVLYYDRLRCTPE